MNTKDGGLENNGLAHTILMKGDKLLCTRGKIRLWVGNGLALGKFKKEPTQILMALNIQMI